MGKSQIQEADLQKMKSALAAGGLFEKATEGGLEKVGLTTGTGLVAVDIMEPAMTQVPITTPFRNMLNRKQRPNPGVKAEWKVINSIVGSGYDAMGWIPEGQRSGVKSVSRITASAAYRPLGEEGRLTEEAQMAARGLVDDLLAYDSLMTVRKLMLKEENSLLFGNLSNRLGIPQNLAATTDTAGGTLPVNTYYAVVVALTAEGKLGASVSTGVPTTQTVTGADGMTFTINGGSSNKSAIVSAATTALGQGLNLTVPYVRGAVGYAWFVGTANAPASLNLQAITTLNCVRFSAPLTVGTQTADQITQDSSYNDGTQAGTNPVAAYDGMLSVALNPANGAFYKALATGAGGIGTPLTATGAGGIEEVDQMMTQMYQSFQLSVDHIWVSAATARAMYKTCLNSSSGPLLKQMRDVNDSNGITFTGGGKLAYYTNPVSPLGGDKIPVMVHPAVPDGIILGYASELPDCYLSAETPAVAEILTRRDYNVRNWAPRTRAYEYGAYTDQVLAPYAPFAMGVIANIAV